MGDIETSLNQLQQSQNNLNVSVNAAIDQLTGQLDILSQKVDNVQLKPATGTVLGGIKVGAGLNVEEDGTLSVSSSSGGGGGGSIDRAELDKYYLRKDTDDSTKHSLEIGDTLTVVNDPQNDDPFVDVEIIGIFRVVTDSVDDSDGKKIYDLAAYFEYNDYVFLSNDLSNKLYVNYDDAGNGVFDVVDFYVSNPENLDSIIQEVKNIKDINWKNFNIYTDDEVYQNTQESVDNSSTLIISLIVIAIIVSISVISIIVFMSIKGRRREIGILLSIGKSKATIMIQFIIEMLIIAGISFTGSYFFSKLIAGSLGNAMGRVAESVIIQNNQFTLITGIGIVILLAIVIISCIPIMNKKPRQILSQMNWGDWSEFCKKSIFIYYKKKSKNYIVVFYYPNNGNIAYSVLFN